MCNFSLLSGILLFTLRKLVFPLSKQPFKSFYLACCGVIWDLLLFFEILLLLDLLRYMTQILLNLHI